MKQTLRYRTEIEKIAVDPPKWIPFKDLWARLVWEGSHRTYGSAVAHYKAYCVKHAVLVPVK